jgi:hypothetical protein
MVVFGLAILFFFLQGLIGLRGQPLPQGIHLVWWPQSQWTVLLPSEIPLSSSTSTISSLYCCFLQFFHSFCLIAFVLALFEILHFFEVKEFALLTLILILLLKLGLEVKGNCSGGVMAQGVSGIGLRCVEGVDGGLNNSHGLGLMQVLTFDYLESVKPVGTFDLVPVVGGPDMLRISLVGVCVC